MVLKFSHMAQSEAEKNTAETADSANDPTLLKDSSTASIGSVFNALVAQNVERQKVFRPTLAKLSEIVSKFQSMGNDHVGFELATFDKLRPYKLVGRQGPDAECLYGLLSIYEARFLVRIFPDQKIDCYTENLGRPPAGVQSLDSDDFWYKTERQSGSSNVKVNKNEPKYLHFNLGLEEDVVGLMNAILPTAAACASAESLREYDLPAAGGDAPTVLRKTKLVSVNLSGQ
jgi:hypothetical protein